MPTSHPRHSVTETPELAALLDPLRQRLGDQAPTLAELVARGAEVTLRELEGRDRAARGALATFVERMAAAPGPDMGEVERIRRADRRP